MPYKIRMLIIDPVGLLPAPTVNRLSQCSAICLLGAAANWEDGYILIGRAKAPDVILYSLQPGCDLEAVFTRLEGFGQAIKSLLMINDEDDPALLSALAKGTNGFVISSASAPVVLQAVKRIYRGEAVLSPHVLTKILDHIQEQ